MAISTYDELKTAVVQHFDDDEITSFLDQFIGAAESDMWADLRVRGMVIRAIYTTTATETRAPLPDDYLELIEARNVDRSYPLSQVTTDELDDWRTTGQRVSMFAITEEIEFDSMSTSEDIQFIYYAKLTGLSTSNASNYILANVSNVYWWGVLHYAAAFLADDQRSIMYRRMFDESIRQANKAFGRESNWGSRVQRPALTGRVAYR